MDLEQRIARIEERLGIVSDEKTTPEDEWVTFQASNLEYRITRDGKSGQCRVLGTDTWYGAHDMPLAAFRAGRRTANKELAKAVLEMPNVISSASSGRAAWDELYTWRDKVLSLARAIVDEVDDDGV